MQRRPPSPSDHDYQSQHHGGEDRAGEKQPLNTVLNGMEDHERKDEREEEQQKRSKQRMP